MVAKFMLVVLCAGYLCYSADALKCYQCSKGGKSCEDLKIPEKKKDMKVECKPNEGSCEAISLAVYEGRKLTHYIESRGCRQPGFVAAKASIANPDECSTVHGTTEGDKRTVTITCECNKEECNGDYKLKPDPVQSQKCYQCSSPAAAGLKSCDALSGSDDAEKKKLVKDCGAGEFICDAFSLSAYRGDKINTHLEVRGCLPKPKDHNNNCTVVKDDRKGDRIVEMRCQCNDKDNCNDNDLKKHPEIKKNLAVGQLPTKLHFILSRLDWSF